MDKFPLGAFFGKGLKMAAGQADVQKFMPENAPHAYEIFCDKKQGCTNVVVRP